MMCARMGTYSRIRSRISSVKRCLMQKPMLILLALCSATVTFQYIQQNQIDNAVTITRQKRSLLSPLAVDAMEINSPSQVMSMSRELHTFYQDSEYEHHYQYYDHRVCVAPEIIDWSTPVIPLYKTSTTRYIMPVLIWGPMNQVEGLRETIALAIRLNRTIVIPPMYRHFTDPNGPNGIVDPEIRIDIPSVRKLISTVSYKSLPATLKPDNILIARSLGLEDEHITSGTISGSRASRLRRFETATGFEIANWKNDHDISSEKYFNYPIIPSNSSLESEIRFEFETTDWNQIFGNNGAFSVLLFPYLTARFKPEQDVGRDIMKFTPRPKFLTSMANDFIQANDFPDTFVTLHYRFDKEDWERSCRRTEKTRNMKRNDKREKICELLAKSTSDGIAEAVASYMVEMFSLRAIGPQIAFYVATPPQQQDMINDMVKHAVTLIQKQLGPSVIVNAKSTIDSARYFDSAYPNCEFVQDNLHEVFSLFEQEICSRGKVFIYAPSSSWSGSIRRERHMYDTQHKLIDHSLLDILENYPKDENRLIEASQSQLLK